MFIRNVYISVFGAWPAIILALAQLHKRGVNQATFTAFFINFSSISDVIATISA